MPAPKNEKPIIPAFTKQDAENLIAIAQRAPLQNLAEAAAVSQTLERFRAWYEAQTSE